MNKSYTKLTEQQVQAIKADSRLQKYIAKDYGITQSNVSKIKQGHIWNENHKNKNCVYCKVEFTPEHNRQNWCSIKCRLFSSVDCTKTCWTWQGATTQDGYGHFMYNQKLYRTHRVAYELAADSPIPEGLLVLHSCDNPPCCNPKHLRLGTDYDNAQDKKKGVVLV